MTGASPFAAVLVALTVTGCAAAHHPSTRAAPPLSTTRPATAPPTTSQPQTPVPTSVDAQGKATTECVTIPASWPMCAAVNGDGTVATLTTIDAHTRVNCIDASAATPKLARGEYNIACRVFKDRVATTQNPADLPGHPLLCALVNEGALAPGKTTPAVLLESPILCINTAEASVSLYRHGEAPSPCRQAGAIADCRG